LVSYYNKGALLALLLDAKVRRATAGRRSLDDVMRLAYRRYSGERGFTADEFRATAEEVAGVDLAPWFKASVASTQELDYGDLLEWFGLRFASAPEPAGEWSLVPSEGATPAHEQRLRAWLASHGEWDR
jgi:predicted metalloprotease with PDZ domain